jgi:hypothetical protein
MALSGQASRAAQCPFLELNRYRAPKRHPGIGFISGVHFRSTGKEE